MWSAGGRGSTGPEGPQHSRRPGDGMGLAALKKGVGGSMVSEGRMADGTLSGQGRTLQSITGFSAVL